MRKIQFKSSRKVCYQSKLWKVSDTKIMMRGKYKWIPRTVLWIPRKDAPCSLYQWNESRYSNLSFGFCNVWWLIEATESKIRIEQNLAPFLKSSLVQKKFHRTNNVFVLHIVPYVWPKIYWEKNEESPLKSTFLEKLFFSFFKKYFHTLLKLKHWKRLL